MKRLIVILFLLVTVMMTSGCIWRVAIDEGEVGLLMEDGVKVDEVLSPGRYGPYWGWYTKVEQINVSALTLEWSDPDLVTLDKQPIGVTLGITFARDPGCVDEMRTQYRAETESDEALTRQVTNRVPRNAKSSTAQYTIDEMLGNRNVVTNSIFESLQNDLDEICVILLDVGVNNIAPSPSYLALLQDKADAQVAVEVAVEQGLLAEENLNKEQKQTEIELELARRENLVNAELAKTYELSPEYFELERLRLLADVIGDNVMFVDPNLDLTLFLSGNGAVPVPVPGN